MNAVAIYSLINCVRLMCQELQSFATMANNLKELLFLFFFLFLFLFFIDLLINIKQDYA